MADPAIPARGAADARPVLLCGYYGEHNLGVEAPHGPDAVWALPPQPWRGAGGPIVVCWRATPLLIGQAWRPYLQALEQLAEQHDRPVLWLPFHRDQDGGLLAELQASGWMGERLQARSRAVQADHPQEAMALFQSAGLVLAMRLHALILAGLSGAPLAALSYDPKVRACAAGLACPCQDLDQPGEAQALLGAWTGVLDHPLPGETLHQQRLGTAVHRDVLERLRG